MTLREFWIQVYMATIERATGTPEQMAQCASDTADIAVKQLEKRYGGSA